MLSLPYGPILTSVHDYCKNHALTIWTCIGKVVSLLFNMLSVVQSLSHVQLCPPPRDCSKQASLSFTISQSLFKLMSMEAVIPSNHLIFWHPLFLLPSMFPSIRIFSNESALCIRWP